MAGLADQPGSPERHLTTLLEQLNQARPGAFAELVGAVYDDLRAIAAGRMHAQFQGRLDRLTMPPTAIVHDAVVRLRAQRAAWKNAEQFFAVATRLLQQLILDYRKHRLREKRGAGDRGVALDAARDVGRPDAGPAGVDTLDLISRLHDKHPRAAEVVTLRVLCGMSLPEIADRMNVAVNQVKSDWRFARAWLRTRLPKS
jgi:RNA polymerase sigma factor (TIGR02999 family)